MEKISTLWSLIWWPFDYHLHDCLEKNLIFKDIQHKQDDWVCQLF